MAALRPCMQSVMSLHPTDVARIDSLFESYRDAGMPPDEAARAAAEDAAHSIDAERGNLIDAIREQHPKVFGYEAEGTTSSGSKLLAAIKEAGGIDPSEARDLTGDNAFQAGKRMRGVFKKGGMSADDALEWAQQNGWLGDDATIADIRALVRDAFDNREVSRFDGQDVSALDREANNAWQQHLDRLQNDPDYRAEHDRMSAEALIDAGIPASPDNAARQQSVDRFNELFGEAELERLSIKHEDDDAAFFKDIDQRLNDYDNQDGAVGKGSQEDGTMAGGKDQGGKNEGADAEGFKLEGYDDAELQSRREREQSAERADSEQQRKLEEKARADAELAEFGLTGSDRAADANQNQGGLFGAGTLHSNPFFNPKLMSKLIDVLFGSKEDRAETQHVLGKSGQEAYRKAIAGDNPVRRLASWFFNTSTGATRRIANKLDSPTMKWVIDQFQVEAGSSRTAGETFDNAVDRTSNEMLTRLDRALGKLATDDNAMRAIANRVRASNFDSTPIGQAAKEVTAILKDMHTYMKEAGVDIGEVKTGYYPREFDVDAIMQDRAGFERALAAEYRAMGNSQNASADAAAALSNILLNGDQGSMFNSNGGSVRTPFTKERVFGPHVDKPGHPLNKFLLSDPATNITLYIGRAIRRAEIARRFGDRFEHWSNEYTDASGKRQPSILSQLEAEGAHAGIEPLKDYVALAAGLRHSGAASNAVRAASMIRSWTTLGMLEKATLSSLTEFITPAIRAAGSGSAPGSVLFDAARNLQRTVADLTVKHRSKSAAERRAWAEDMHLIASAIGDTISSARFSGGEPLSRFESQVLSVYFRRIGLTQWTEATRVAAVDMGRTFIRRLATQVKDGDRIAARHLRELGIPEAQVKQFADAVLSRDGGMPTVESVMAMGAEGGMYRTAVGRFLEQSIMNPKRTTKPSWMSHPVGAVIGQLQAYNYGFFENVWKRNAKMAAEAFRPEKGLTVGGKEIIGKSEQAWEMHERLKLLAPMGSMPLLMAAAYAVGEMRDELLGDPNKRVQETDAQKYIKAASRGTPLAPVDPWLNMLTNARYNSSSIKQIAGPGFGTVGKGVDATFAFIRDDDATNSNERKMAQAFYDIVLEPGLNTALSIFPSGAIAPAIATQFAGSGKVREAAVSAVAGENKQAAKDKAMINAIGRDAFQDHQRQKEEDRRRRNEIKKMMEEMGG